MDQVTVFFFYSLARFAPPLPQKQKNRSENLRSMTALSNIEAAAVCQIHMPTAFFVTWPCVKRHSHRDNIHFACHQVGDMQAAVAQRTSVRAVMGGLCKVMKAGYNSDAKYALETNAEQKKVSVVAVGAFLGCKFLGIDVGTNRSRTLHRWQRMRRIGFDGRVVGRFIMTRIY